ncbi:MAG: DNA recombination protein RmuC [Phycisphaerales bacterium]
MLEVALVVAVVAAAGLAVLLVRSMGARVESEKRAVAAAGERDRAMALAVRAQAAEQSAEAEVESLRAELKQSDTSLREKLAEVAELRARLEASVDQREQELKAERAVAAEKIAAADAMRLKTEQVLKEAEVALKSVFEASAGKALKDASEQFAKHAETTLKAVGAQSSSEIEAKRVSIDSMVKEMREKLAGTATALETVQKDWAGQRAALGEQLRSMGLANEQLRSETGKLVKALREPQVRGRYGEIQLRRVAELAGMRAYCDFVEQDSTADAEGNLLRPDMIVRLPNGRELVVDAKANLKPYIDALEAATPEEADAHLNRFADGIVEQAKALAKKTYWDRAGSPEFVVMFVPGDQFVDAALSRRADLLDVAASNKVILVSPCSLIAMLRAVAVGFQERMLSEKAGEMAGDVKELNERLAVAVEHLDGLGSALASSVSKFNQFVGSYQTRVLPQVRKIEASGVQSKKAVSGLPAVEVQPRSVGTGRGGALPAGGSGERLLDV